MTTEARYDAIADFYQATTGDSVAEPAAEVLLASLGDPSGLRVLDLACGHGRISRELARRGAQVVGADLSNGLLEKARAVEVAEPLGVTYLHADVTAVDAFRGEQFDAVSCNYGLSDIDDLHGALASVARVLTPRTGVFVFSILHPCFPGWGDDAPSSWPPGGGYYQEGWWLAENAGFRGRVGSNFRMLSTYLNALVRHGLTIEQVDEPEPGEDWARLSPGSDPVPVFLVVRCRRS